jgi:hypothetical protein
MRSSLVGFQHCSTHSVRRNTIQLWQKWDSIFALDEDCIKSFSILLNLQRKERHKKLLETSCGDLGEGYSQRRHYCKGSYLTKQKGKEKGMTQ